MLYLATWTVIALTPGPAVMCTMAQSARHGFRSSLAVVSGVQFGIFLLFASIGLGLGTLLAMATTVFTILRVVGAIYLFYLGLRIIYSTFRRSVTVAAERARPLPANHGLFLRGLLIQLTNPQALMFVPALVTQFIDPHRSASGQLVIIIFTTIAVDSIVLSSYAFLAHRSNQSYRASRWSSWLERICGAALIFYGVRLLFSQMTLPNQSP